ncbi:MAG: hypothetical protein KC593_00665 [Myxococcales bacterium]|nr:hypothetical protein [Myxococcales bacterium]MCB9628648.1 hypothetical protein [Sandaracinaceae bacterium]
MLSAHSHRATTARPVLLALATAVGLSWGCDPFARELGSVPPCGQRILVERVTITPPPRLDLLFVVDDSSSMEDEQRALRREIPRLVRILTTGDVDDDGLRELERIEDLHVGVVRTDMGTGPYLSSQCPGGRGADGVLVQTSGVVPGVACASAYPPFVSFPERSGEEVAVAAQCLATVGTGGCNFEQPLEALLKALTPSTAGPLFVEGRVGHGDGANVGFLRPDAALVVVLLTDEDDCSSPDDRVYQTVDGPYPGPFLDNDPVSNPTPLLDRRCATYRDAQYDVERYVEGLLALRTRGVVLAAVVGLPLDASAAFQRSGDFQALLRHPGMQERPDPQAPASLVPACTRSEGTLRSNATPARRIVKLAEALRARGGEVVLESICRADTLGRADYSSLATGLLAPIAAALGESCLSTPLRRLPDESVRCQLDETLPLGLRCEAIAGRTLLRVDEAGREVCRVTQLVPTDDERALGEPPAGVGWFYDDYSPRALDQCPAGRARLLNFAATAPTPLAELRVECVFDDVGDGELPTWGSACTPGAADACALTPDELARLRARLERSDAALACEPSTRLCELGCASDGECPLGFRCAPSEGDAAPGYCTDPRCD